MGITYVTASLENLAKDEPTFESEFLVDTGSIHCFAPADELAKAGISIEGRAMYELADGSTVEYPYGFARVSFMGSATVTQVVFGPAGSEPLLGLVALENTGIGVDPATQTPKRFKVIPLKVTVPRRLNHKI